MSQPIKWRPILLEAFFVVLGVLLALSGNEWRQDRINKNRAEAALDSIIEEISANQSMVHASIEYHSMLVDTLTAFMMVHGRDPSRHPNPQLFSKGFTNPAPIVSRAWETAMATGVVEYMDYEDVLRVSQLYESQDGYEMQSQFVGQEIYSQIFQSGYLKIVQNYQNLNAIVGTYLYRECELAQAYAGFLPAYRGAVEANDVPEVCQRMPRR